MSRLIAKFFIKDYKNITEPSVRNAYGRLAGILGIVSNVLLSIIKIIAGILAFSVAIIADALNNLTDAAASLITFVGFKLATKPADRNHPFGHQRIEYITGLIISFFIIFLGGFLLKSGIEKIIKPEDLHVSTLVIILLIFSIFVKIWQFFFYRSSGKLIKSKTLIATAKDSFNDVFATTAILISLLIWQSFGINIDGYMTIVVAIFILISGIKLVRETISPLIGEAPAKDFVSEIEREILAFAGVLGVHDLVCHLYGPGIVFITAHVEVDGHADFIESHNLIDEIERYINEKYNANLVIHMDPVEPENEYSNKIKMDILEILANLDPVLDIHDFRVIRGNKHDKIIFDVEVPEDFHLSISELKGLIEEKIKELNPNFILFLTFDIVFKDL